MSANTKLLEIFEKKDAGLINAVKTVSRDLKPPETGGVVVNEGTLIALTTVRDRYAAIARKVSNVSGGGKAKRDLLKALAEIDAALAQFTLAMNTTFSLDQIVAMDAAGAQVGAASRKLNKVVKRLGR